MLASLLLDILLFFAFIIAPQMTNTFFLNESKTYSRFHGITLALVFIALVSNVGWLTLAWPAFCVFGGVLYLKTDFRFTTVGLAKGIPILFSLISSVWFFSGMNDLQLLGYDRTWSFYAALHGSYLGWLLVGCFAVLAKRSRLYLFSCYLFLFFFLMVAFGINGVPYVKKIGVVGFATMVPALIAMYFFNLEKEMKLARLFSALSLFAIALSMSVAVLNEFSSTFPRVVFGLPAMVITHGLLNAVIGVPCFYLALKFEWRASAGDPRGSAPWC